jgi:hypothetical protein
MAPGLAISAHGNDSRDVPVNVVRELISHLLAQRGPDELPLDRAGRVGEQMIEALNRANGERGMAGMPLACQLCRTDTGRWPARLADSIPNDLPAEQIDPWGDGHQPLGYVMIKGGLPDDKDRQSVYSRCESRDGFRWTRHRAARRLCRYDRCLPCDREVRISLPPEWPLCCCFSSLCSGWPVTGGTWLSDMTDP